MSTITLVIIVLEMTSFQIKFGVSLGSQLREK